MFYMQAIRLFSPLLTLLIATGITLGGVKPVAAEQVYIGLRNGPSEAFPVIYEVTPYRRLEVVARRGSWVNASDGRNSGWLHVDDLHLLETFPRDELWKLVNDARPGKNRLEVALSTASAYSLGWLFPVLGEYGSVRYTRAPEGDSAWSMFDAGIITQFAEPADHITFSWNAFAGYAQSERGNTHWSDTAEPVWVGGVGVESMWRVARYFDFGARGEISATLDSEMTTHRSVSIVWRLRL
ncbi:MAG: hypothetical protein VX245_06525 [Pseudomonadota bacterium]|nr:hypothetical protein A3746_10335 [Oleibacter sp. HI0075]MEE3209606.1 hypothetical protein [Pseudomonadota bacterium]|tara:strand:+ start:271 stop:990 length:720 start_codon:yes stop_codon:yes gene_type:complete